MTEVTAQDGATLAKAVIATAWRDFTAPRLATVLSATLPSWAEYREARLFLTAGHGAWREARELWCDAAAVCPNRLRGRALVLLGEGRTA